MISPPGARNFLAIDGLAHGVNIGRARLFDCLLPHMHAEIGGFDRIIRHTLVTVRQVILLAVGLEIGHELLVLRRVHALVIVPGRQMPDKCRRVHTAQFVFRHAEGHDGSIFRAQALVGEFFVEWYVAVAIDRADDASLRHPPQIS